MLNVFSDFHHAGLLNSLILLFEKRLGGNVYRPIGMEWAHEGFWKVYDHPETQAQYLGIGSATPDGSPPLNDLVTMEETIIGLGELEVYQCQDIDSGQYNKAITLSTFYEIPIDIVIASLPQHIEPFARLCELHPNKPKLVYQIGNSWDIPYDSPIKNVMASAKILNIPPGIHFISYHQEFDTKQFTALSNDASMSFPVYKPCVSNTVYSFANCFSLQDHFREDFQLFEEVEKLMSDWSFKCYGGGCRDGAMHGSQQVAEKIGEAMFIWHTKKGGDGYGHVIHNAFAMGRPPIVKMNYYDGKMAGDLMIDGETCINIDGLNSGQIVDKILHYSELERYRKLSHGAYTKFKQIVDFDHEAHMIKEFISNLI